MCGLSNSRGSRRRPAAFQVNHPVRRPQLTEEELAMSEPTTAGSGHLRTLAVRITEDLRAQLDIVAQLTGRSTTEEIRLALEHWIEKTKADPVILKKAEAVRAEIERKAQTERAAIAAIFGAADPGSAAKTESKPNSGSPAQRRPKNAGE